jgi:hypothetical protein
VPAPALQKKPTTQCIAHKRRTSSMLGLFFEAAFLFCAAFKAIHKMLHCCRPFPVLKKMMSESGTVNESIDNIVFSPSFRSSEVNEAAIDN